MVLNGKASVPGLASEPASEPTEEAFTKNIGLAAGAHGLDAKLAGFALTVAKPEESKMSIPELDPLVGGAWSQRLYAAVIVIVVVARDTRLFRALHEITFPPVLPAVPGSIDPCAGSGTEHVVNLEA